MNLKAGKALDKPICQLLSGPFQTRMRACSSVLFGDTPAATYDIARRWVDAGFTAVKFGWGPIGQSEANDIALVREARRRVATPRWTFPVVGGPAFALAALAMALSTFATSVEWKTIFFAVACFGIHCHVGSWWGEQCDERAAQGRGIWRY